MFRHKKNTPRSNESMPSSKSPAQAGHPGHLDPGQQHKVEKMYQVLKEHGFYSPTRHTEAYLCRFLRARKWDFDAAKAMLLESEEWRKDFKVDELYEHFSFPEKEAVNELYPQFYHKTDKDGRPVYVEQLGKLDLNKLFKVTTPERLIQQLVYEYEKCINERMPVCSELYQKPIETSCTIMDLKNVGIGQFWKVSSYVQQASKIGQHYYPETMGRFYIINAPYIFTTVWTVVKAWLDPVTREKIQILGSNYIGEIARQIPLDHIPTLIGGKCQCETPGGCMMSDAGPWNTPEGKEIIKRLEDEKQRIKKEYAETGQVTQNDASEQDGTATSDQPSKEEDASDKKGLTLGAAGAASAPKKEPASESKEAFGDAKSDVPPKGQSSSTGLESGVADLRLHPEGSQLTVMPGMERVSSKELDRSAVAHNDSTAAPSLSAQGSDGLAPPITSEKTS